MEMREAILSLHSEGETCQEIARTLSSLKVTKSTAWYTIKRYKYTGSVENRPKSGRPRSIRTRKLIEATRSKIRRNPKRSIRKLASEAGVGRESMRKVIRKDLKMKAYHLQKRQLPSAAMVTKRLSRAKVLRDWMKAWPEKSIIWTDEKNCTVEQACKSHNDRILARNIKKVPVNNKTIFRRQHPASVMVWAGVTSCGKKTPLISIPEGVKVNQVLYLEMLTEKVLPWAQTQHWDHSYCFQQDEAPSHTANKVQEWCQKFFPEFWSKEMWPPSSPDLNVMDYAIWSILERKVGVKTYSNVEDLKVALLAAWADLDEEVIRRSCGAARKRLNVVIKAKGGYCE
ncbi:uncharacterized protein LOC131891306 [Tigriopus californicus]|uniref:uncharacterized protein LOC131891306 n=1 Tax=Tigriopus californicus TaxID=6832 RepID=UPI0027DA822A|nr:uncharacterized protein LOC131891306 [Tigriopus californicus]